MFTCLYSNNQKFKEGSVLRRPFHDIKDVDFTSVTEICIDNHKDFDIFLRSITFDNLNKAFYMKNYYNIDKNIKIPLNISTTDDTYDKLGISPNTIINCTYLNSVKSYTIDDLGTLSVIQYKMLKVITLEDLEKPEDFTM